MKLIQPSTLRFITEARQTPGYSLFDFLHGYIYGRWTHLYIAIGTGRHPLSKWLAPIAAWVEKQLARRQGHAAPGEALSLADTYHGKTLSLEAARQLVLVNEDIHLPDLEQVIPYKKARAIILKNPDHIVALECPCRAARPNPCHPMDVCLVIGEPFASFVIEHCPEKARWISRQEAIEILEAENRRGHVQHAFFKDAMLGRFYAICNCCACCCGALQAHRQGTPMLASSGYVAQIEESLCAGCGACLAVCQFSALRMDGAYSQVDLAQCMGCGVCVQHCPTGAISLQREPRRGVPLEIHTLMKKAAKQNG
ncbi:MAG: 4Fe-4S ferredoxin [Anaerolineae bacterium]|nr:MAG: 4Fe-4S ferredoxin [Anaerolineae bacterium]